MLEVSLQHTDPRNCLPEARCPPRSASPEQRGERVGGRGPGPGWPESTALPRGPPCQDPLIPPPACNKHRSLPSRAMRGRTGAWEGGEAGGRARRRKPAVSGRRRTPTHSQGLGLGPPPPGRCPAPAPPRPVPDVRWLRQAVEAGGEAEEGDESQRRRASRGERRWGGGGGGARRPPRHPAGLPPPQRAAARARPGLAAPRRRHPRASAARSTGPGAAHPGRRRRSPGRTGGARGTLGGVVLPRSGGGHGSCHDCGRALR